MEEHPTTIRIFPGELRPVYYTSVLAFPSTNAVEVIRLTLERLQIFEDKTLYEIYEGRADHEKADWTKLAEGDCPVTLQAKWKRPESREQEFRFHLRRKEHASLVLTEIVSQYISPEVNEGRIQDMCDLEDFSELDMRSNLRARFCNKDIYTYVGSILISINPYYFYSIYNPKYGSMYQGKQLGSLPPHIFAIADASYHAMLNERQNQSVIISGESGAGKTEATKFLLHHLMNLSAKLDESQSLELITLGTGPVLEAFGNARTVANNNSSRFGKFILVQFRENGAYHGASIEKYLLEKSRIVSQAPGERNYHVFYYLLAGADAELKKKLKLLDISEYSYLAQGADLAPENGAEEYHRLRQALSMLRFGSEVQMRMFTVLSAILQLGNVEIGKREKEETEVAEIRNMDAVEIIASLLQVDVETLQSALITRTSRAGGTDAIIMPYRVEQAVAARDSMAKALYSSLFDWIVDKVNITLSIASHNHLHKGNSIGVLDIFGFEVFLKNSFEQFCINYANEQLQQYFNKHIFKVEQAEYIAEGIEWSAVSFIDNQDCLDLIARKPTGLLPLLDEECSFPGADDNSLFQKFERQHKADPCYRSPQLKLQDPQFTITHYASEVTYSIKGFREKNRDLMRQDIIDVLKTSHMDLVRALIGQPPYAVYCWRMAYLKIMAAFAFRKAGEDHRKKDTQPLSFKLRGSPSAGALVNARIHGSSDGLHGRTMSVGKNSVDALIVDRGRLHANIGMRPSRSFDALPRSRSFDDGEVAVDEPEDSETTSGGFLSLSMGSKGAKADRDAPIGGSPMISGKKPGAKKAPPPVIPRAMTLPASSGLKKPGPEVKGRKGKEKPRKPKKAPPTWTPQHSAAKKDSPKKAHGYSPKKNQGFSPKKNQGFSPKKEQGYLPKKDHGLPSSGEKVPSFMRKQDSRLASVTRMQERLLKRLSRRSKEAPELRERPSNQYWNPTSRLCDGGLVGPSSLSRSSSMRHGPPKTVSAQFQQSLISLVERLEKTNPYFVRCIKSNGEKAPCKFDDDLVLRQLRYTGMMETIKIRRAGYPVRMEFEAFYEKYQFLMGPRSEDLPGQIEKFLTDLGFGDGNIQIGESKVFMREKQKQALQDELREKVLARIIKIQRWVRAKLFKCRFLHLKRCTITLQCAVRVWIARRRVDAMRRKVCSAVLIQSAWRGFVARKELVLLKQAAIILQAHWRGRMARMAYRKILAEERKRREEERKRAEEQRRREEERERQRREEERRRAEEQRRREEEEKERQRREEERRRAEEQWRREEEERQRREEQKRAEERQRREERERQKREEEEQGRQAEVERLAAELQEKEAEAEQLNGGAGVAWGVVRGQEERERVKGSVESAEVVERRLLEEEREARELVEEMGKLADEQLQLLEKQVEEEERKGLQPGMLKPVDTDVRCLSVQSTGSSSTPLDVRETLFHFDTIVSALEAETMKEHTPSPLVPSRPQSSSPVPPSTPSTDPLTGSSRSLTPLTPSQLTTTMVAPGDVTATKPGHVTDAAVGGASSDADRPPISFTNGLPNTPPAVPPSLNSEPSAVQRKAKIKALKQQFLVPQQPARTLTPSPPLEDIKPSRGKVKDLIAQMGEPERVLTPPPSPLLEEDLSKIRNSKIISNTITHLTQGGGGGVPDEKRSYTPSVIRRRVTSPFLDQVKDVGKDGGQTSPQDGSPDTKQRGNVGEASPIAGEMPPAKPRSLGSIPGEISPDTMQRSQSLVPGGMSPGTSQRSPVPTPGERQRSLSPVPVERQRSWSDLPERRSRPGTMLQSPSLIPKERQRSWGDIPRGERSSSPIPSPGTLQRSLSPVPLERQRSLSPVPGGMRSRSPIPTVQRNLSPAPGEMRSRSPIPTVQRNLSPIPGDRSLGRSLSPVPGNRSPDTTQRSPSPIPRGTSPHTSSRSPSSPRGEFFEREPRSTTPVSGGQVGVDPHGKMRERAVVISVRGKEEPTKNVLGVDQEKIDFILNADSMTGREGCVATSAQSAMPTKETVAPAIPPRSSSLYSRRASTQAAEKEEEEEAYYSGPLPIVLDSGDKDSGRGSDDDHLVALVFPRKQSRTSTSSYQSTGGRREGPYHPAGQPRSGGYQPLGNYRTTPTGQYQATGQAPPLPPARKLTPKLQKKRSNPVSLDDVFLSFESEPTGNKEGGVWATIGHEAISSTTRTELPVQQNSVLPPPQESRSQYDHLPPPLEPPPGYGQAYYRNRSTSDVTSHRIKQIRKANLSREAQFMASEVIPREHASEEYSQEKRKRSALSLADPSDMLKTGGLGSGAGLEASSEFTRCLTSDEIMSLNQRVPSITSPSERLRLFSFTKRHLKLPFSKGKGKREKDLRDKLVSPDKELHPSIGAQTPGKHRRHSPTLGGKGTSFQDKAEGPKRNTKYPVALAHHFQQTTASKFGVYTCATCSKGFTGFMKQALKCVDCNVMVHRHCMVRAPPCKAHIESGSYVTMSRRKIIHKPEDLDDLGRFLLEKIAVIVRDSSQSSVVDKVFKHSLKEFHTFLISTYSLSLQSSVESNSDKTPTVQEEPKISLTFSQLVFNFDNIFRSIAKREGLNDPCHIAIGINQIKTFLDEFGKSRRSRKYSSNINPHALRRKTNSGRAIQPKVHKGHKFLPQQFKVPTICEHCSKAIPLLESGEVCEVCGCAYHEGCYRKVHKKCEGKARTKDIPEYKSPEKTVAGSQFGVPLQNLVPPNTIKVPTVLEVCLHFLEANGLYTQGLYRKSAGSSSKAAVRAALEEDPETAMLENYSVHAVAAAVGAFFRELPEPLLTWEMYLEFIRAMDLTNKKERQETLHKLIACLPEINHAVFERFIFHLARVAQHEHINKMGPSNLAIIFAPCLLRDRELKNPESPSEMLRDLQKQTSCLETIITEQVEKLTATIRGIRTLTSFARETETKLSELSSLAEVSESSAASTPSSTLKHVETRTRGEGPPSILTAEERNRLTSTLEEIERERAELAVNLPKLEPFLANTRDEGGHTSGDSDRWTPTPSPSPSPSPANGTRRYRGFSPITESAAEYYSAGRNRSRSSGGRERASPGPILTLTTPPAAGSPLFASQSSPSTPNSATSTSPQAFPLPHIPMGPVLPSLTKNRVSQRPLVRPPTTKQVKVEAQPLKGSYDTAGVMAGRRRPAKGSSCSGTESDISASDEELLYETTV